MAQTFVIQFTYPNGNTWFAADYANSPAYSTKLETAKTWDSHVDASAALVRDYIGQDNYGVVVLI